MEFSIRLARESRNVQDPTVPVSSAQFAEYFGLGGMVAGVNVNYDNALGVPAVWSAVNFIAGTLAGLPCNVYRRGRNGRTRATGQLHNILHDAPNPECSSFEWRKGLFESVFTVGRSFTFIERNQSGSIVNLWPLEASKMTVKRVDWRKTYEYQDGSLKKFDASEIIDIPFMLKRDMLGAISPIMSNKDTIGLAIAATNYGARFFENGGVPPFVVTGNFVSKEGLQRASKDLEKAVREATKDKRQALALPVGHELKALGVDPEKSQMVELHRFLIEQIARIYSLPPVFLQDLTHGTFSNTEQQDLHFVKHTLKRWVEQFEQELNLKLFGRSSNSMYVELNVDGLLRGDMKSRYDAYATGIQNAFLKPNEVRELENRTTEPGEADKLHIQGATVPLGQQNSNNGVSDDAA